MQRTRFQCQWMSARLHYSRDERSRGGQSSPTRPDEQQEKRSRQSPKIVRVADPAASARPLHREKCRGRGGCPTSSRMRRAGCGSRPPIPCRGQPGGLDIDERPPTLSRSHHALYFDTPPLADQWQSLGNDQRPGPTNDLSARQRTPSITIAQTTPSSTHLMHCRRKFAVSDRQEGRSPLTPK